MADAPTTEAPTTEPTTPATEPPPLVRPAGHQFTRAEVGAMTRAEYAANRDVIRWQTSQGTVR